jgi:peroxiredoxin
MTGSNLSVKRVKTRVVVTVFFASFLFNVGCSEKSQPPIVGEPVPEIVLPDLEGKTFRLSQLRGKVVLLNFWASWCPPCVDEMPSLEKLHRALQAKGLEVVAISVDDSMEVIENFKKEYNLSFRMLFDKDAKVAHGFETFKYPETYIVDRDGILLSKIVGPRDWITPAIMLEVVGLLKS